MVRVTKTPFRNEAGDIVGVLGFAIESPYVQALEQEVAKQKRDLEIAEHLLSDLLGNRESASGGMRPSVFICYKHGREGQNTWTRTLAEDLTKLHGLNCLIDENEVDFGDSFQSYMQRIQTEVTHVLFVITPESVKAVETDAGGVAFELQLAAALRDKKLLRLIPILREGTETPAYVKAHRYIDFRDDALYYEMLKRLADSIQRKGATRAT